MPSKSQYAMIGEFGGIGAFQEGHMWTPKGCHTYLVRPHLRRCPPCAEYPGSALTRAVRWRAQQAPTAANESATYVAMVDKIIEERIVRRRESVSVGTSEKNQFIVQAQGLPSWFELFQVVGGAYVLKGWQVPEDPRSANLGEIRGRPG